MNVRVEEAREAMADAVNAAKDAGLRHEEKRLTEIIKEMDDPGYEMVITLRQVVTLLDNIDYDWATAISNGPRGADTVKAIAELRERARGAHVRYTEKRNNRR